MSVVKRGGRLISLLEQPAPELARKRDIYAGKNAATPANKHLRIIAQLITDGQVKAVVGKIFSLPEARQAHELSQTGHGRGRIVLHIAG
jgi:NADPH:quinone reductase-like Zn-dependent oxidoreductase